MTAAVRVLVHGLLAASVLALCASGAAAEPRGARLALVIAEAGYPGARLPTAEADAGLMASALAQAGFDVTALLDPDASAVRAAVGAFAAKLQAAGPGAAAVVFVDGYGLQYAGENWLVPAGAAIGRDDAVPAAAVSLAELTAPLQKTPAALRLFLFDLARETPFAREGVPLAPGLALTEAPVGSLYGFNAAPGTVAHLEVPPYGAYARALAEAMQEPGLAPGAMLRQVRLRVAERTDGAVLPYDDGSSEPGFAFFPGPPVAAVTLPTGSGSDAASAFSTAIARDTLPGYAAWLAAWPHDPLAFRVLAMAAARREALIWSEAVRANTPRAYWTYQRRYPRGPHAGDVRRQLFTLHAALEPPPRFEIVPFEGLPPPTLDELAVLARADRTFADGDGPSIPTPSASLVPGTRGAFFETLAAPPIVSAGALPLPLPVGSPEGRSFGRVDQPAAGPLVTSMRAGRDGPELVTSHADGQPVFRLVGTTEHGRRSVGQLTASGAVVSRVTIGVGADGGLAATRSGPTGSVLERWNTREGKDGARVTTMFDAAGRAVATTVAMGEIVTTSAALAGSPPRFVLAPVPDGKGDPVVLSVPDSRARPDDGRRRQAAAAAGTAELSVPKVPALPNAAGLTGEVPKLDLPPAPPTPAFDAAAAPLTSAVPDAPEPASKPTQATPAGASASSPTAEPRAPGATAPEAPRARARTDAAFPNTPPLPPPRVGATEPRSKRHGGR